MTRKDATGQTDVVSLVFGILFAGLAALWLLSQVIVLTAVTVAWLVVGALLALGAAGIIAAVARAVRRHAGNLDS